ncbi:MAG: hypothetical protein FWG11_03195 [Promicromonosporaceae bacterium]|nr:hypothetical protein [Promicromonosporaceae bacterium]
MGLNKRQVDERFAQIAEELSDLDAAPPPPSGPRDWSLSPEAQALVDADGEFEAPNPGRQRWRHDPPATLGWLLTVGTLAIGVVLLILQAAITAFSVPTWIGWAGAVAFLIGAALLVARMPQHRRHDDDETGAVV